MLDSIHSVGEALRMAHPTPLDEMSDGEALTRAREAYIAQRRPFRWMARRIRAGLHDKRLRAIVIALRDTARPMTAIIAERDEATCALIMRATPGLEGLTLEQKVAVAAALMTAVRVGRRG